MNLTLTMADFFALSPLLILLGGALLLLLIETFTEKFALKWSAAFTILTFAAALAAEIVAPASTNPLLTPWLKFDGVAHFFNLFFLCVGIASGLLAASFFKDFSARQGEYCFLLIASVFGAMLIGASADFLTLFLGLETLSIALYILCSYMKEWSLSQEAAIKYFFMGSIATAFFLYGVGLIYGATGTTNFDALLPAYQGFAGSDRKTLFLLGASLLTIGLAFKAAIVPFHTWAPDVYDGAPTPVTAFMAVGTKAAAFAAFVRIFFEALPHFDPLWNHLLVLLAYPTLIYANLLALRQQQMRRFFAYSGISHAGFLLIPLAVGTPPALTALLFYLVVYAAGTLGAFAVLSYLDKRQEGVLLDDLRGLYARSPWLAALMILSVMTLAGIPPTAGFFAKFALFKVAFEGGYIALAVVGLLMAIVSAYYYFRVAAVVLSSAHGEEAKPRHLWTAATVGVFTFITIVALSIYPEPLFTLFESLNT